MLISAVTVTDLKKYANVYHNLDDSLFSAILTGAKQFISSYTGLPLVAPTPPDPLPADYVTPDNCDQHEDLTIALFILSNEMYDNRMVSVENNKIGFVIKHLLDSHSTNLL